MNPTPKTTNSNSKTEKSYLSFWYVYTHASGLDLFSVRYIAVSEDWHLAWPHQRKNCKSQRQHLVIKQRFYLCFFFFFPPHSVWLRIMWVTTGSFHIPIDDGLGLSLTGKKQGVVIHASLKIKGIHIGEKMGYLMEI